MRVRAGLKQFEAAKLAGISVRMLSYVECGERKLSADKQAALTEIYNARMGQR